jgi:hypothetical protein
MTGGLATVEAVRVRRKVAAEPSPHGDRRRFTLAAIAGIAVVTLPYLWVLWVLWTGPPNPLRSVAPDNFYEYQARALLHGHLDVPNGVLQIEGFIHDGKEYTYFGLFPSLIRIPVLIFTSSLDGKLTAPSMLLAWLATGAFTCLLLWRLRVMVRGEAPLGRAEAASYGFLTATVTGGSVLVFLAATPFVYNEDFAWSVALALGSVFALLGVLERPSSGRVAACGSLIVATNLNRAPPGYACVIGAVLVAGWFALARGGRAERRWALPMLAVGLGSLAVNCAVTYAKFGLPFGLPMADQVWAHVNAHRRYFLAANGGKAFSVSFIPSTATAYLQPGGLRFTSTFPFVALPPGPARAVGGVVLDQTYPTSSVTASMPLLFLLSCWGVVATFLPKAPGRLALARIPVLTAGAAVTGVLVWGYIADRYMGDFMPLLVLASSIALVDLWRRLANRRQRLRSLLLGAVAVLAAFGVAVNVALAATPSQQFSTVQTSRFVQFQDSLTPGALSSTVRRGTTIPYWAPAGTLFDANHCSGLYLSTGDSFATVPGQQLSHSTWIPVEQGPGINHNIGFTFNEPVDKIRRPVPVLRFGASTVVLERAGPGRAHFRVENPGGATNIWPSATGWSFPVTYVGKGYYEVRVMTDPNLHLVQVWWYGEKMLGHYLAGNGPAVVQVTHARPGTARPAVSVMNLPGNDPSTSLCHTITES